MDEFAIFKRFNDKEPANEFAETLKNNQIEYELIEDSPSVDVTFTGNSSLQSEIQLLIKQSDFEKATQLFEDKAEEFLVNLNKDHYLFDFVNEELFEILTKPDEWSALDYKLAQKILKDRGEDINDEMLTSLKQKRIAELSKPDKGQDGWIIFGYIFSALGGFLGIIIGWSLWTMKKTLPNGDKVYIYSEKDRMHGKRIFTIGIIVFPIALMIMLWNILNS